MWFRLGTTGAAVLFGLGLGAEKAQPTLPVPRWTPGIIHTHTTFSDGERTVASLAEKAGREGARFVFLTDHYEDLVERERTRREPYGFQRYREESARHSVPGRLLLVPSVEIASFWRPGRRRSNSHLLALGLDRRDPRLDELLQRQEERIRPGTQTAVARRVRQLGETPLAAHPHLPLHPAGRLISGYRKDRNFRFDKSAEAEIDGVELFNSDQYDDRDHAWLLHLLRGGRHPVVVSGADFHLRKDENLRWSRKTFLHSAALTREGLLEAVRNGRSVATHYVSELELHPEPSRAPHRMRAPRFTLRARLPHGMPRRSRLRVYRDGVELRGVGTELPVFRKEIRFDWEDRDAPPGRHSYVIHIPHVLTTSPIVIEDGPR